MTHVTASCPFQREHKAPAVRLRPSKPPLHPTFLLCRGQGGDQGPRGVSPKVGTSLLITWCSCVKEPHVTKTVRTRPPPRQVSSCQNVAHSQAKVSRDHRLQNLLEAWKATRRLQPPLHLPMPPLHKAQGFASVFKGGADDYPHRLHKQGIEEAGGGHPAGAGQPLLLTNRRLCRPPWRNQTLTGGLQD